MAQKHSRLTDRGRAVWLTEKLWEHVAGLPIRKVSIDEIDEFDQNCWFGTESSPTLRAVAEHALKISAADLSYPIILSSAGSLMDGGHRLCKAWMLGHTEIDAVQFSEDPEPDYVLPIGEK
jgi:hypothetical protein